MEKRDMKDDFKDLPIGSTFVWRGLVYEVKESSFCIECSFYCPFTGYADIICSGEIPECGSYLRKDRRDVIFVKVGEVQD